MSNSEPAVFDTQSLADSLYALRAAGRSQATAEFSTPQDLATAMKAQQALALREGATRNAWKVAMSPDKHAVVAPLHPYVETARDAELPYLAGMKFEVEIAVRLGRTLPVKAAPYSREEILDAVSEACLGAELLSSAIEESGKLSFPLYVADRIGNCGYALGPAVPKTFIDTIGEAELKVIQGSTSIYQGPAKHPVGDVLAWLLAYANDSTRPANSLEAGMLVTTGALSGAMPLPGPGKVEVLLAGRYALNVALVA